MTDITQTAPLKKKIMHRSKNFYITIFTSESWVLIEKFIEYAVKVFNCSHPSTETTIASTMRVLEEWWDYYFEDYLWDNESKEYDVEARREKYVLDKDNSTYMQTYHISPVDSQ